MIDTNSSQNHTQELAIFAGGCFWGIEELFNRLSGVIETEVGYIGGTTNDPTYNDVCRHKTGHAEAVRIEFNPTKISYADLVTYFYSIHDPTTKDRQGVDIGSQYRSAIYYLTEEQKSISEEITTKLTKSQKFQNPIVTEITKASSFYRAEDYHQKYYQKHPGYACHLPR